MRWLCGETIKDLIKGYFWCSGIHERKIIIILGLIIIVSIPKYVITVVNKYFKSSNTLLLTI